ncbi:hypothetical protein A0H81_13442 [Grifola frondosa]|uniref:Uncharacterized protein n=1 Tax=Grifola frondosa TaxID=5627 RepID=A0A1C7LPW1_GRIFR|nr:hypothetical protein A0H81_13442 [Grifola frondosa]
MLEHRSQSRRQLEVMNAPAKSHTLGTDSHFGIDYNGIWNSGMPQQTVHWTLKMQPVEEGAVRQTPDYEYTIITSAGDVIAVWRERNTIDRCAVA